jgi:type IV pilus assembly protein PilC
MAAFTYTAINAQGLRFDGEVHAPSADAAREQLRVRGLLAERLDELASVGQESVKNVFKKVKPKSLQIFARQFATMIDAGLNIVGALVILEDQTDDKYLAAVIRELRADVEGGLLLSQAMDRHPKVFTRLFVSMVQAGEAAGILDQVLDRMAFQIERETKLKRQVKGAMMYPIIVLIFATIVLIGMLLFLVPIFTEIFTEMGGELPKLTQYVVSASEVVKTKWWLLIMIGAGSWFGFKRWRKSESGGRQWDRFKLKLPMGVGVVVLKVAMARFSRTLSTLVGAGVDILTSLEVTSQTAGNALVEEALNEVRVQVHEGASIAQPILDNPVFPPMVGQMVKVGEETGELDNMLSKIADFYEDEVNDSIKALTSIIEPLMMIGVGLMIGVVIIAMYLPMFKLLSLVE